MQTVRAKIVSSGKYISACCPFCVNAGKSADTKFHLYVRKDKWVFCFRCGYKTSYERFVKSFTLDIPRGSITDVSGSTKVAFETTADAFNIELDSNTSPFNSSMYSTGAINYLKKRHIDATLMKSMNVKLGKHKLFGRVVFIDDVNKYYVARSFIPGLEPKTLNPVSSIKPLFYFRKKSMIDALYMVEGTFDAVPFISTGRDVVALLGKEISPSQLKQLWSQNINNVVISLDTDAFSSAIKLSKILSNILPSTNIGIMTYEKGKGKDPGDYHTSLFESVSLHWVRIMNQETLLEKI